MLLLFIAYIFWTCYILAFPRRGTFPRGDIWAVLLDTLGLPKARKRLNYVFRLFLNYFCFKFRSRSVSSSTVWGREQCRNRTDRVGTDANYTNANTHTEKESRIYTKYDPCYAFRKQTIDKQIKPGELRKKHTSRDTHIHTLNKHTRTSVSLQTTKQL